MISEYKPKLSIITICLNESNHIRKTCDSLVSQLFINYEWIVIDGSSTDDTLDILYEYKERITVLVSEPDKGIYDAMNKGINLARGEYVIFLNGGDYFQNKKTLFNIFNYIGTNNIVSDFIYGDVELEETGAIRSHANMDLAKRSAYHFFKKTICHQSILIKRELFIKYGLHDISFKICGDYEFLIRCIVNNKATAKYIPFIFCVFNLRGVSTNYDCYRYITIPERHRVHRLYSRYFIFYRIMDKVSIINRKELFRKFKNGFIRRLLNRFGLLSSKDKKKLERYITNRTTICKTN